MIKLPLETSEYLLKELKLIVNSTESPADKMAALIKLFYKTVKFAALCGNVAFKNFYAQYRFVASQIELEEADRKNMEGFRRFVKEKLNPLLINEDTYIQASQLINRLLNALSPENKILSFDFIIGSYIPDYFVRFLPRYKNDEYRDMKILVSSWSSIIGKEGSCFFILEGYNLDNMEGTVKIIFKQHPFTDFVYLHSLLSDETILWLSNLKISEANTNQFVTTYETLITIEPDYLIDATAVGECFQYRGANSKIFLLSKIIDDLSGSVALKGSMIGYYLDEMIRSEEDRDEQIFLKAQKENALKAAQFGREEMQNVKKSVETEHLPNIRKLVTDEKQYKLWIEPTFFSNKSGLQGRIDLLSVGEKTNSQNVLELKSGSSSNPNNLVAWPNHQMQVICYDMMLESTYGDGRNGTNSVFYSKCSILPRRNIVSENREKQQTLKIRNEIMAIINKIAKNDFSPLEIIKQHGIEHLPTFSKATLEEFQKYYIPGTISTHYYNEMFAFTIRELINAKIGDYSSEDQENKQNGLAALWLDNLFIKERDFEIIYEMEVDIIDEVNGYVKLIFNKDLPHSFRKSDLVILYPKSENDYNALNQHILKGSIKELHNNSLIVSLFNKQTDYSFINQYKHWAIEPDIFERNYWSTISSLFHFLKCEKRKKKLIFGVEKPVSDSGILYNNPELTNNQNHCIENALQSKDYYLLQGPPGTGKTSTFLVKYIQELLKKPNEKLVVLAYTNKAVERICENFKQPRSGKRIPYIRIGSKHVEDDYLFSNLLTDNNPDNWQRLLKENPVLVSTVATFKNNLLLLKQFIPYKQVVVDEASQLTEADLAGVLSVFEKFVLIGDQKQLPAVITQKEQTCLINNEYLLSLGISNFRTSLFERLIKNAQEKEWIGTYGQLSDHYRMHKQIANLICRHYRSPLQEAKEEQRSSEFSYNFDEDHPLYLISNSRTLFIETPPEPIPKKNKKEAELAAYIAETLIRENKLTAKEIGIITPFRAQIAEIKKNISIEILEKDELIIDTVERYQGDERKLIIFSTTVANGRQVQNMQNIAENDSDKTDRKLLVSISRASEQIIVLGNSDALRSVDAYDKLLSQIINSNGYLGIEFSKKTLSKIRLG